MTGKEAIERIKEFGLYHAIDDLPNSLHTVKAFEMAISALEKQIPKKPIPIDYKKFIDTVDNATYLRGAFWCPNCNHVVRSGDYCNDCGQAIDWSDIEPIK